MRLSWRSQQGAVSLEAAIVLPILLLLLFGGLLIGLTLFCKAALTYQVFVSTEDDAIRPLTVGIAADIADTVVSTPPPGLSTARYRGFGLRVPYLNTSVSAACYSLPLGMPRAAPLPNPVGGGAALPEAPPEGVLQHLTYYTKIVEDGLEQAHRLGSDFEQVLSDIDMGRQIVSQWLSGRKEARLKLARLAGGLLMEEGMQLVCEQNGPWVVSARAVALVEKTKGLR